MTASTTVGPPPWRARSKASDITAISNKFRRILEKSGVEHRREKGWCSHTLHSFRHSFASDLMAAGVGEKLRMELVGHADVNTNRHYTHARLEQLRGAVKLLEERRGTPEWSETK